MEKKFSIKTKPVCFVTPAKDIVINDDTFFWEDIYFRREQVRKIFKFDCDFQNGLCKEVRKKAYKDKRGCCRGCAGNFGYHEIISKHSIPIYKKLYDMENGFWRQNGCILPDKLKSTVCLSFSCNHELSTTIRNYLERIIRFRF